MNAVSALLTQNNSCFVVVVVVSTLLLNTLFVQICVFCFSAAKNRLRD